MIPDSEPTWFYDKFRDLPKLAVKKSPMDDAANEFHSDVQYYRDLLSEIAAICNGTRVPATPFPITLLDDLDAMKFQLERFESLRLMLHLAWIQKKEEVRA